MAGYDGTLLAVDCAYTSQMDISVMTVFIWGGPVNFSVRAPSLSCCCFALLWTGRALVGRMAPLLVSAEFVWRSQTDYMLQKGSLFCPLRILSGLLTTNEHLRFPNKATSTLSERPIGNSVEQLYCAKTHDAACSNTIVLILGSSSLSGRGPSGTSTWLWIPSFSTVFSKRGTWTNAQGGAARLQRGPEGRATSPGPSQPPLRFSSRFSRHGVQDTGGTVALGGLNLLPPQVLAPTDALSVLADGLID